MHCSLAEPPEEQCKQCQQNQNSIRHFSSSCPPPHQQSCGFIMIFRRRTPTQLNHHCQIIPRGQTRVVGWKDDGSWWKSTHSTPAAGNESDTLEQLFDDNDKS